MARPKKRQSFLSRFDWALNPETLREVLAVLLFVVGGISFLGIVGLAGNFGTGLRTLLLATFGMTGFLVPLLVVSVSVWLWMTEARLRGTALLGGVLLFFLIPAFLTLVPTWGGALGSILAQSVVSLLGPVAGYLLLFGLIVVGIILVGNLSLKTLFRSIKLPTFERGPKIEVQEPQANVFTTVTRSIRNIGERHAPSETAGVPVVSMGEKGEAWRLPPLELLEPSTTQPNAGNISKNVEVIEKTLKDFGIDVSMGEVHIGPTVTQYTLKPAEGVKLSSIAARTNDLSLALAAHPIRIEAPIPGKAAVGIEVPNKSAATVTLREVLESKPFKDAKSNLAIGLGLDVAGAPVAANLGTMPHLLIAGATGSGKSIALNSLITTYLMSNAPTDLKMILIDPKRVEFTHFSEVPHLLTHVVNDVDKTVNALRWTVAEMDRRFKLFAETHRRDIGEYNSNPPDGKMPYIVIVVDELADLMSQAGNEVEAAVVRLAQMARATGIHLVLATQRPSVDVITGLIKANITSRIAFAVASQVDSRTIIDQAGADRLLGRGDMLFQTAEFGRPKRVQGTFLTSAEIKRVTDFLKENGEPQYDESILTFRPTPTHGESLVEGDVTDDLLEEAKQVVVAAGKASASLLQRRLRIGYARAARILDILEAQGVVGPADGAKPRDVLITATDYPPPDEPAA